MKYLPDHMARRIRPLNREAMRAAEARQVSLTKPRGALGRLETLSMQLAGMTADPMPSFPQKVVVVMAADHGVAAEGVSAYPADVTRSMVANIAEGGAAINVISRHVGARVIVTDVGVDGDLSALEGVRQRKVRRGTASMAQGPVMTREEAVRAIGVGIELVDEVVEEGASLFATGEMGIGNTTASSAVTAVLTGRPVVELTGRGTGIGSDAFCHKVEVIEKAIALNKPDPDDPVDVLAKVGGLEIAALTGVILGAAAHRRPVVMDGFVSSAAALAAVHICPEAVNYILPSHVSVEIGHQAVLEELGLIPLFDLQMRLGEGTGAALAFSIIDVAVKILAEMATFESAGVANRTDGKDLGTW